MSGTHKAAVDGGSAAGVIVWRVSSFCSAGDCVAVARTPSGQVLVKDTKDPDGLQLRFDASEWRAFLAGVHAGEFE